MLMRALVTGATGFVGSCLLRELEARGVTALCGVSRDPPRTDTLLPATLQLHQVDLRDVPRVADILTTFSPTHLYHLAGYADPGGSSREPAAAWCGNLEATRGLLEAVLRWGGRPRILFVSSGTVYGEPASDRLVDEQTELRPQSPYAASKAAAEMLCCQYLCEPGLDIVRARPFNHIGPGQSSVYAVANFARQLAAIERRLQSPVLRVGNLAPIRDFTDVRDVVRAYALLLEKGTRGAVYNVASGHSQAMGDVVRQLASLCKVAVRVEADPALVRRVEWMGVRVNVGALRAATGWSPRIPWAQTLADTLDDWRGRPDHELKP